MTSLKPIIGLTPVVALAAMLAAAPALAEEITVWDFKSGDPNLASYFDTVKSTFEAAHPGVTVSYVMQPHDQYYTLLGTALAADAGPDVFLMNGGAQAKARLGSLLRLDDKAPDLVAKLAGREEFQGPDGGLYALPITLQGFVVYYNRKLYAQAGLDPDKPPTTWAGLQQVCEAFKAKGGVPCFVMGNKEGFGAEFFFSAVAATSLTAEQQADFAAGRLKWSSPPIKAILQAWVETGKAGWYQPGANSTAKFMDEYEMFMRGDGANTIGLLSDVAHWKQFGEMMGVEAVGVFRHPSPTVAADKREGDPKIPVSGGIGYGVNRNSGKRDLAVDLVKTFASAGPIRTFVHDAGVVPADTTVTLDGLDNPALKQIQPWLASAAAPTAHANSSAAELEEWHRQSQRLLNGETSVDAAAAALDAVQARAKPQM
ncbi:ABC transporter substrate-binding protein [Labrys wisconsinensis]|uniref:ABC-type glycerol-3-phosphate transport system substrate-binding protein n=1 Tax=Labrys wisconsinensis TaxID=425677 RepID=A0ABU0JK89_9HYPH|nr:extracellular solute-binding protein [Labrys wisconsinensis]MDQ0474702.1 ABC-type glycerol-3-phosphate transport system substrate-binding protein [Labrys wisconsinensis]